MKYNLILLKSNLKKYKIIKNIFFSLFILFIFITLFIFFSNYYKSSLVLFLIFICVIDYFLFIFFKHKYNNLKNYFNDIDKIRIALNSSFLITQLLKYDTANKKTAYKPFFYIFFIVY